jgi:hypothetical protein
MKDKKENSGLKKNTWGAGRENIFFLKQLDSFDLGHNWASTGLWANNFFQNS